MRGVQRRTVMLAVTALVGSVLAAGAVVAAVPAQAAPSVAVFGGYADTFVGTPADHPRPWQNEPTRGRKVLFVGCNAHARFGLTPCRERADGKGLVYDGGALMLENTSPQHVLVSDVSVTIEGCTFDPWPGLFEDVPPDTDLVLTQTSAARPPCGTAGRENFDSSDTIPPGHDPCVNDKIAPIVHLSVDGVPEILVDTAQVLDTRGKDLGWGGCRPGPHPENLAWEPITGTVPACHVENTRTHDQYPTLQNAVGQAHSGDQLIVTGYCKGTTSIFDNLTITGHDETVGGHTFTATLDGNQQPHTLWIDIGRAVTLDNLIVTGGNAFGSLGGGIYIDYATVTLSDVSVTGNEAGWGAGVFNDSGGLVMKDGSTITTNTAQHHGGGIYNFYGTLAGATCSNVHNNTPDDIYSGSPGTGTVVCP